MIRPRLAFRQVPKDLDSQTSRITGGLRKLQFSQIVSIILAKKEWAACLQVQPLVSIVLENVEKSERGVCLMIKSAALSDVGKKRKTNQDCYLEDSQTGLYLVADGMGGHAAGAEAAKLTVTTIDDFVRPVDVSPEVSWPFGYDIQTSFEHNVLRTGLLLANLRVCHAAELSEHSAGMGSTLVAVWIRGSKAFWTHVGDSRLYLLRAEELRQLSEDHTLVQEQLKRGIITLEEARTHSLRHVVTRSVGSRDDFKVEVNEQPLETGDLFLLCCDGLTDKVKNQELRRILLHGQDLEATCRTLVNAAIGAGGDDNITVVLLRYGS